MSHRAAGSIRREEGTASVETVATVPFLLLAVLVAAQIGIAGHAIWSAAVAARAGSRAELVGRDAAVAARRALPDSMRPGARVEVGDGVEVRVGVPRLLPWLPTFRVGAGAGLGDGDG